MRSGPILAFAAVVALAVGAAWMALSGGGGAPDAGGTDGAGGDRAPAGVPDAGPATGPGRARAAIGWTHRGDGRVIGALRDAQGRRPIGDVTVELAAGSDGPDRVLRTRTTSDGSFVFESVPAFGGWTFRARVPDPPVELEHAGVVVATERTTDLGIVCAAAPAAISGRVIDAAGAPIAGAEVRVLRPFKLGDHRSIADLARDVLAEPRPVDRATSDAQGNFRLERVPPGAYDVTASRDGYAREVRRVTLVVGAAPPAVQFVLAPGSALRGRVQTGDGAPIAGVTVRAIPGGPEIALPWTVLPRMVTVTSGSDGSFVLPSLASGAWKLQATLDGTMSVEDVPARVPSAEEIVLVLEGDAEISGRTLSASGAAVPGAQVFVSQQGRNGMTVSGADGAYTVRGLASGLRATLMASAAGQPAFGGPLQMAMGDASGVSSLDVVPGVNPFDVKFGAAATLRGRIVERGTDAGIAGVRVRVRASDFGGMLAADEAFTAADGRFEVDGLAVGEHQISLEKSGWHAVGGAKSGFASMLSGLMEGSDDEDDAGAEDEDDPPSEDSGKGYDVVTTADGVVERTLEMERAGSLAGRVVGPDGAAVAGARVWVDAGMAGFDVAKLFEQMTGGGDAAAGAVTSAADGTFELPSPPGKLVRVKASSAGLVEGKSAPVKAASGARVEGVEVKLDGGGSLTGRVVDGDGAPVADAAISWNAPDAGNPFAMMLGGMAPASDREPVRSAADGTFRIDGVKPGKVTVTATRAGFLPWTQSRIEVVRGGAAPVEIALEKGAELWGVVVDAAGRPVARATVSWRSVTKEEDDGDAVAVAIGGADTTTSDAAGAFRFAGLAVGEYRLTAAAPGMLSGPPVIADPGAPDVVLTVVPELKISGVVLSGVRPVAGVRVTAISEAERDDESDEDADVAWDGGEIDVDALTAGGPSARVKADGSFEIGKLRAGTYTLVATPVDGPNRANVLQSRVRGVAAGSAGVTVECAPGQVISGTVRGSDGRPVAQGTVEIALTFEHDVVVDDDDAFWESLPDEVPVRDGAFRIVGLPQGLHTLTVRAPGHARQHLDVAAGRTDVEVRLVPGAAVKGRVLTPNGKPKPWASFTCVRDDGDPAEDIDDLTGLKGAIDLDGLTPGAWVLRVEEVAGPRLWSATVPFTVKAGETIDLGDVRLADVGPAPVEDADEE